MLLEGGLNSFQASTSAGCSSVPALGGVTEVWLGRCGNPEQGRLPSAGNGREEFLEEASLGLSFEGCVGVCQEQREKSIPAGGHESESEQASRPV